MINPAEDDCNKQCGPNETKPRAIKINPRKRHNTPTLRGGACLPLRPRLQRIVTLCVCGYWVVTRLLTGCMRSHPCVRATCVR